MWERHLQADAEFMKAINANKVFGHLEHPDDGRSNLNLAAIKIESLAIREDGTIIGELSTLSTEAGKTAAALFNDGLKVGISSRGHGSVKKNSEGIDEVQEDFVPESFDLVAEPSTPGADLVKESLYEGYIPSAQKLAEGKIPEDVQRRVRSENGLAMLAARLEGLEKQVAEKTTTSLSVHEAGDLLYELHNKFKADMKADEFISLEERIVSVKEFSRASMPEDEFGVGSDIYKGEMGGDDDEYAMPGMGEEDPYDDDDDLGVEPGDEEGCPVGGPRRRRMRGEMDPDDDTGIEPEYDEMRGRVRTRGEGPMQDPYWGEATREAFVAKRIEVIKAIRARDLTEAVDTQAAEELVLFIENDGNLYRQQHTPIHKNLITKWARGMYDSQKAVKLFMYLTEAGAKKYAKEFDSPQNWNIIFTKQTREEAAKQLRDSFESMAREGEFTSLLPNKYAGFIPEAVADLYHKLKIYIDFSDLTPEQREKFDLFRPGEDLSGLCTTVKTGLPADLDVMDCEGRWESGDKICLIIELKGNPKAAMRSAGGILGQKIKMEAVMGGKAKGGSALSPDVVKLVQGLRDRCRALTTENARLDGENKRLRELTDAMTELYNRDKLQRTQESILAKHPELKAAIPELNKARTVEELKEKAGVFLGISGHTPNFGEPEEEDDKGAEASKTESTTGRPSTRVRNGVPRPGEINEGGDNTITDGNAGTEDLAEGKDDQFTRLARHYRTQKKPVT